MTQFKNPEKTLIKINYIWTKENSLFGISVSNGIKLLNDLRLNFSHLNEYKFRNKFNDTINSMYNCGADIDHDLLHWQRYSVQRGELLNSIYSLREKCPNTEFFLVRIFPHSDWIRRDTSYLSVFSPNTGKYGPEKTPYLDNFHAVHAAVIVLKNFL